MCVFQIAHCSELHDEIPPTPHPPTSMNHPFVQCIHTIYTTGGVVT